VEGNVCHLHIRQLALPSHTDGQTSDGLAQNNAYRLSSSSVFNGLLFQRKTQQQQQQQRHSRQRRQRQSVRLVILCHIFTGRLKMREWKMQE